MQSSVTHTKIFNTRTNARIHCGFYFIFIQCAISYKHNPSSRIHTNNIISAHCASPISLYYFVQSYTHSASMHANVLFFQTAVHTLICIINILFCLNLSILSTFHPDLRYPDLTVEQLKIYRLPTRPHVTPNSPKSRSTFDQHLISFVSASRAQI